MKIGVPLESHPGERRVATTPEVATQLIKLGYGVVVQGGAGAQASFSDDAYRAAGCEIVASAREIYDLCDIVLKVRAPEGDELGMLRSGQTLISFVWPAQNPDLLQTLTERGVTALAMDSVPRISRAQKMDALSSMAQHRRLSRRRRGRAALRPLLHRPDHRRRQDSAGQGPGHRRRCGRACRDRRGQEHGRHRPGFRYAPRSEGAGREHGRRVPRCSTSPKRTVRAKAATPRS